MALVTLRKVADVPVVAAPLQQPAPEMDSGDDLHELVADPVGKSRVGLDRGVVDHEDVDASG